MKRENRENRSGPRQRVRLTDSLVAAIFHRENSDGQKTVFWNVDRFNPEDESSPFRTLRCKDLLEAPEFIQLLASAMAEGNMLPESLRKQLARLAAAMAQVGELMKERYVNGEGGDSGDEGRVLSFS